MSTTLQPTQENRIEVFLKTMDIVREIEGQNAAVADILNDNDKKAKMREKLVAAYVEMGREPNPAAIDEAIESVLSHQYEFAPAQKSFATTLAHAYINRGTLIRQWFVTPVLAASMAITSLAIVNSISNSIEAGKERDVEEKVVRVFSSEQQLEAKIDSLSKDEIAAQLPSREKSVFNQSIAQGRDTLKEAKSFFDKYCPLGKSENTVTRENYAKVTGALPEVESSLGIVQSQILSASDVLQGQRKIISGRKSLDSAFQSLKNTKPTNTFAAKAQQYYNEGSTSLDNRNTSGAREAEDRLHSLKRDIEEFPLLVSSLEQEYQAVKKMAKEKEAVDMGDRLYQNAQAAASSLNIAKLRQDKSELQDLKDTLGSEYTVRIVSRPGVKSGIDRYYTDENGKRLAGFYLIVEAVTPDDRVIPRTILNDENKRKETVDIWGERVPAFVYEQVKSDKIDDGTIQNDKFAFKPRGHLNQRITFKTENGVKLEQQGRITRW